MKNPILLHCPFPIITARLTIRPIQAGDGKALNGCVVESFEQFKQWLPWAQAMPTLDSSEEFARTSYADFILRKAFHLGVFREGRLVAMCGFNSPDWSIPSAAVGYWCRVSEQRKGYVQEAVAALTLYGFKQLGLRRIVLLCQEENVASIRVAEKSGFILESTARGVLFMPGKSELLQSRCYVRFDSAGLDQSSVSW